MRDLQASLPCPAEFQYGRVLCTVCATDDGTEQNQRKRPS